MRPISHRHLLSLAILALLGCAAALNAQVTTGTILGTVADPSGAVIPGASVTATHVETGISRATVTDDSGSYVLANLPIGTYRVTAELPGFKVAASGPFRLVVDQKLRSDFALALGEVTETVQVRGIGATLLQTDQHDINQIIQEKEIRGLPLNGRDFFSLLLLSNGVQDTSTDQGGATTNVTFSINGMRPESNSVTLDGIEMSSIRESDVDMRPNLDAVSEFKVLTSAFSAEYGHTAGGVISIQSKGGTNEFHASLFEFLRNDAFNAANFFRNPVNPGKAPLRQNQFGGTAGGPIKKNKTFFFVDYQGYRLSRINEGFARVPEAAFRDGDFSALLAKGVGIYDPASPNGADQFRDPSRATSANPQGLNIIPRSRFNSFGHYLLNAVALPNLPDNFPLGNHFVRQRRHVWQNEAGTRIDHSFSKSDTMFVRYRWSDSLLNDSDSLSRTDGGPSPGIGGGYGDEGRGIPQGGTHRDRNNNLAISEVHVFSPKLLNEARFGFHKYHLDVIAHAYQQNLAEKFGLKGVNDGSLFSGLPAIYLNDYNNIGTDDFKPLFFVESSMQFNDNVTYNLTGHTLKFGFEYRPRTENNYYALFPSGAFYFYGVKSSKSESFVGGHELADLLLGYPWFSWRGRRFGSPELKDRQYGFFLQDDWKVSDRLTLNLGLRYEYASPFFSPNNEISLYDIQQKKLLIPGRDGVSRYIIDPDKNNWAPRVGFAYQVNKKTTVRGGLGLFYDPATAFRDDVKFNPPSYRQYTLDNFYGGGPTWFFFQTPPPFPDPGDLPRGYDIFSVARDFKIGYSEQYSLAIQRELPFKMLFEAAYVGSQAHKLPFRFNYNKPFPGSPTKPAPELGEINEVRNVGDMSYNSGQFKLERRFSQEFFFLTSYTWSKSIDNVGSSLARAGTNGGVQNIFDLRANRSVSDYDIPHRLSFSYVYELPFGRGKQLLSGSNPVLTALLGNWQTTGVFAASSGLPATVVVSRNSQVRGGTGRPDLVGDPNLPDSERGPDRWFNIAAFKAPPAGRNGNAGRNIVRGPGYFNFDLGLMKSFYLREQTRVQFRTEFFNLTNTPHFALPVMAMDDSSFGKITHTRNSVNFGSTATSYANRMIQFAVKLEF
ncbi:MAG TPA: TonB-dependent receptor [Acidobacteriota bacterium]|jgi:outer membrane receptor protein involved in Fe transport